jgi:putative ATP-binding cassette transporter
VPNIASQIRLMRMALGYWLSHKSLTAWLLSLFVILCTIILVGLNLYLNKWQAEFYNYLQRYHFDGFLSTLLQFLLISCLYVIISGYQAYFRLVLHLRWRQWLTEQYIDRWLHQHIYYYLNILGTPIDNPAQRISEDVHLFVTHTLDLILGLLRHSITLVAFSAVLWQLSGQLKVSWFTYELVIPGYLVWAAFLYAASGTWLTIKAGRPLIRQSAIQQATEAQFRAGLDRVKDHDECIALYGGESKERSSLMDQFQKVARNCLDIAKSTRTITLFSAAYSQVSIVFTFLVAAPRYFNQEIQLGQLFEISGAYWYVHSAFSYIIDSYNRIALWKALVHRLQFFHTTMNQIGPLTLAPGRLINEKTQSLSIANLTVLSLQDQPLIQDLTLTINPKERLLISGSTGSGKTTLFRTLAGIWPNFHGRIVKPGGRSMMFLPQSPYFPVDTLRNVLLYPHLSQSVSEERLSNVLHHCKLPRLASQLDDIVDWGKVLSVGEQQCLSISRAILHQPEWLFLDEATSSMDKTTEYQLYHYLRQSLPNTALISIGHRETLDEHHQRGLQINPSGSWHLFEISKPLRMGKRPS